MRKKSLCFFLFLFSFSFFAQDGFRFVTKRNKVSIPFKLINNLVFIPLQVNGVELTFLLDSGVEETVLFSLEEKKELRFKNIEKIKLKGLGSEEEIEGLKATGNLVEVKGLEARDHLLYVILDQNFNLSSHIGIPVNGIIGYSFLKDHLIEINYAKKRITLYKETIKNRRRIERRFEKVPITIERAKPYLVANVSTGSVETQSKLLIDIGNSDAVWLFQNSLNKIQVPQKSFEDYLGKGFSGDVHGSRARIGSFSIANFKFKNVIGAFPDSSSVQHVKMVSGRIGSVGGEILKRFRLVFDYSNNILFLNKNSNYDAPFVYNKSGVEISHTGMQWVQETVQLQTIPIVVDPYESRGDKKTSEFKYKFQLKPVYEITSVRKDSPAAVQGLKKGDVLIAINGHAAHRYSLQEITFFLKAEEEKWITIDIDRNGMPLKFKFQLLNIL